MKRLLLIVTLSLCLPIISFATHNLGGYISYKHLSGFTYEITVTTFTEISSVTADRCELMIDFGDGTSEFVGRTNGIACSGNPSCLHCGVVSNWYKINEYLVTHTFPINNRYTITIEDPNRTAGIVNLVNSVNNPFSLSTEIVVNQGVSNNSPTIIESPVIIGATTDTIRVNLSAFDLEGDILTYNLVTPLGQNSQPVIGYSLPNNVSIDHVNGEFEWVNPLYSGIYVFAVEVNECRNGNSLGKIIVDFIITISLPDGYAAFPNLGLIQKDYFGRNVMNVAPNDSINFNIVYQDLAWIATRKISLFSEVIENGGNVNFSYVDSNLTSVKYDFNWIPTVQDARCSPYILTFRGNSIYPTHSDNPYSKDFTVMVFVKDQSTLNCSTVCGGVLSIDNKSNENAVSVSISPNPINSESVIQIKSDHNNLDYSFVLYNMLGKRVRVIQLQNQSEFTFYKENLPSGLYIYELSNGVSVLDKGKLVLVD